MEKRRYTAFHKTALVAGPAAMAAVLLMPTPEGMTIEGQRAAAVTLLMVVWWISEAVPLSATALVPIALFPILGVLKGREVTLAYGDANIFLFAGGFFIAMAMQKWNLHERLALNVISRAGANLRYLVLAFMLATAFLSMWISNTATTLMMLPIASAVIAQVDKAIRGEGADHFAVCLLLGLAYAASIGGVATLIGTPPNIVLTSQFAERFPDAPEIGFFQWMLVGVPFSVVFLPIVWVLLTRVLYPVGRVSAEAAQSEVQDRLRNLGPMSRGEIIVLTVSVMTALSWMFRADINLGVFTIPGWSNLFPNPSYIHDSTVALFFTVVLFVTPVDFKKGEFALDWDWAKRIPWGVLILFGGGIALAKAFEATDLVHWMGGKLTLLGSISPFFLIGSIATMLTFVTELTSNTATTNIMMPVLGGAAAPALGVHPLLLMLPAAISASCAFMLPVATPPNAIVFGAGRITIPQMARAGIIINLVGIVLVTLVTYFIAVPVFGISLEGVPEWALQNDLGASLP